MKQPSAVACEKKDAVKSAYPICKKKGVCLRAQNAPKKKLLELRKWLFDPLCQIPRVLPSLHLVRNTVKYHLGKFISLDIARLFLFESR